VAFYWRHRAELRGRREWRRAVVVSAAGLLALIVLPLAVRPIVGSAEFLLPGPLTALGVGALVLDLVAEIRARWRAPGGRDLVAGPAHNDVADAVAAARECSLMHRWISLTTAPTKSSASMPP